ncbi:MAG: hypothetical protein JKY56_04070 [Kofleriaceae bacterium]|nr:hypothetical protein [Kofleriaceae bacterium]
MTNFTQNHRTPAFPLLPIIAAFVASFFALGEAEAQYSVPSRASGSQSSGAKTKKAAKSRTRQATPTTDTEVLLAAEHGMVMPEPDGPGDPPLPWEIGVSLNFITSEPSLGGETLEFTDLMLMRLHTLFSFSHFDLFLGTDILPKQPSYTDELAWQGSLLGVRTNFWDDFSAWTRAQGGPILGQDGYWVGGDFALEHHLDLQKFLFVDTSLGFSHNQLLYDQDDGKTYISDEVFTRVGLSLRDPEKGLFAAWLNFDYYLPVYGNPGAIDPQPRVNMRMGALSAVSQRVDLFIEFSILDRGDLEDARTTLPILNGGFDQRTLIMGFMRHFGPERKFF